MIAAALVAASLVTGSSTMYHSCDGSTTMTASGRTAQVGYAANNWLPLGTWVEMRRPSHVQGLRYYRIFDRGGPGFELDFWARDCATMGAWGRRTVTFRVLKKRDLYRGKPIGGWQVVSARRGGKLVWRNK